MKRQVTLTIDARQIVVSGGATVLDAAKGAGIPIPHLCHLPGKDDALRPCLLCLVDINGEHRRACRTEVKDGMVVTTDTHALIAWRRERLQKLASHHYGDCKAPCNLTCPIGINVQGYVNLIANRLFRAALELIREKNALPGIICRVCPRFCESRCRRVLVDEPIAINDLKRFVVDNSIKEGPRPVSIAPPTGYRVAIIGGGPAGLAAAYYLRKNGHEVTIFETEEDLGGMARYGIPAFMLPRKYVDYEINNILRMGIHLKTKVRWGRDFDLKSLFEQGYNSILIATGQPRSKPLEIEGAHLAVDGMELLRKINDNETVNAGRSVIVIGGGRTAVAAARALRRLKAEVTVVYPRSRQEMPVHLRDVKDAEAEGVRLFLMAMPVRISRLGDQGLQLELARTVLGEPDERGNREPKPMDGSRLVLAADTVVSALGQQGDPRIIEFGEVEARLSISSTGTIKVNPTTMKTNLPWVYAAGDVASGPRTTTQAVDAGRRAAEAIHKDLTGRHNISFDGRFNFTRGRRFEEVDMKNFDGMSLYPRVSMPARPGERRVKDFDDVEFGYTEEMAVREARRCLQCGCLGLAKCKYRELSRDYNISTKDATDRLRYPIINNHKSIQIDANKCIICHKCERSCAFDAIKINYKEIDDTVTEKAIEINRQCVSCGACVDNCPTGALVKKNVFLPLLPGEADITKSVCTYCGTGCNIEVHTKHNVILEVKAQPDAPPNYGELCVKGRFGFEFQRHPNRLTRPLIREGLTEPFTEVPHEYAIDFIAKKLSNYRGDSFATLSSAKCTNEENYVFQKFVRAVMGTNNIDHCARLCHAPTVSALAATLGSGAMTNSIEEIGDAACILAIGTNTVENHPVIFLQIKRAIKNGGKLIVVDPREIGLCKLAHIWLRHKSGTDVPLLMGMARVILEEGLLDREFIDKRCENFDEFKSSLINFDLKRVSEITGVTIADLVRAAKAFAENRPATILYAMGITQHSHGTDNVMAVSNLALITGNVGKPSSGVNPLRGQNNVQGACDMGALPASYPGYQRVDDKAVKNKFEKVWGCTLSDRPGLYLTELFDAIDEGRVKAVYIMGENPVLSDPDARHVEKSLKNLEFLVVQDIFLTETARLAHVVLPAACSYEKEGTFTNTERRVQLLHKTVQPPEGVRPDWEIICEIAKKMGADGFGYLNPSEIMNEIAELTPSYAGINYERLKKISLQWPCPNVTHPGTRYLHAERFTRGKGKFVPLEYKPSIENPDHKYPFILSTGRNLFHYHTGTMTRKCSILNEMQNEELIEINPYDAKNLEIEDGDTVTISSRRGEIKAKAKVSERSPKGTVFMTFHFAESPTNQLTNSALDPVAKIPEFKVCAVNIKKYPD
ncbi:MAG: formate dehydrogenase subunit alpha [Dissulfurimicrobium sp.]|uniref:formate dehydrogenase subunit alpha n=1 Tax=Dissulfurimicrobium sp. TaxID=2022436 RepID=UPI003D11759D